MRQYGVTEYTGKHKKLFEFLITKYGFKVTEEKETDFSYIKLYQKKGLRISFNYDIKDNFFYFVIIKGDSTKFPNDLDNKNIKTFYSIFKDYDPNIDFKKLQPDNTQYEKSLKFNAELLEKYGDEILN